MKKLEEALSELSVVKFELAEAKGKLEEAASSIASLTIEKNALETSKQELEAENAELMNVGADALADGFELAFEQICCVLPDLDLFRPVGLGRLLGTPSHWLPVDSCKEGQKGRPSGRLHSDAQVSQQETPKHYAPPYLSTAYGTLKVVKKETVSSVYFSSWQSSFPSPLCVTSRLEQATKEFLVSFPKVPTPFPTFPALSKLFPSSKRLKAHLIIKRSTHLRRSKRSGAFIVP